MADFNDSTETGRGTRSCGTQVLNPKSGAKNLHWLVAARPRAPETVLPSYVDYMIRQYTP